MTCIDALSKQIVETLQLEAEGSNGFVTLTAAHCLLTTAKYAYRSRLQRDFVSGLQGSVRALVVTIQTQLYYSLKREHAWYCARPMHNCLLVKSIHIPFSGDSHSSWYGRSIYRIPLQVYCKYHSYPLRDKTRDTRRCAVTTRPTPRHLR